MDCTILINQTHLLDQDYVPPLLIEPMIPFDAPSGDTRRLLALPAARAAHLLFQSAKEHGIYLCAISGYRTYERQKELFQKKSAAPQSDSRTGTGASAGSLTCSPARSLVAPPGASEHQTGLALDVSCQSIDYALEETFSKTKEGHWLSTNAPLFGFIIRYPRFKEEITGYAWEPWHIRYVTKSLAIYLALTGQTLEEYYMHPAC